MARIINLSKAGIPASVITLDVNGTSGVTNLASVYTNGNLEVGGDTKSQTLTVPGLSQLTTVNIDGGTIDNTIIGSAIPAAATVTNLEVTGGISKAAGLLTIESAGGISLDANGGSDPTLNLNSSGSIDLISSGAGNITISPKFAATGDIILGNATTGEIDLTADNLDVNIEQGIRIDNTTSGNIDIVNSAPTGDLNLASVAAIDLDSGTGSDDGIQLHGVNVGTFIKVQKGSAGTINAGQPVYVSGFSGGTIRVEIASNAAAATMPVIGIATTSITQGGSPAPTGEIIISGTFKFASGTIIPAGSTNDPIYVGSAGNLQTNRPTSGEVQVVGRVLANSATNDEIYVNCVGYSPSIDDLTFPTNATYVGDANGNPISTAGKLEVDVAANSVILGDTTPAGTLELHGTSFRAEVVNSTVAGVNNFILGLGAMGQAYANGGGGINNTAIGLQSMSGNVGAGVMDAAYNVAVGQNTLASGTGLTNTVLFNTAVGYRAMAGTGAGPTTYNTAIGANALENINSAPAATLGDLNTAIGSSTLFNLTNGEENVALGSSAGSGVTTGDKNTFVGSQSNTTTANVTEATGVGYNADVLADGGVALGANTNVQGAGGIALGARAIAGAGDLNIKVDNLAGPTPQGGLQNFADRAAALAAGLTGGDVYCLTPGGPDNPGTSFVLAIV